MARIAVVVVGVGVALATLVGCSRGPLKRVVAGEWTADKDDVAPKQRVAAGSRVPIACELAYDAPAGGILVEVVWSFRPRGAPPGSEEKILHRAWGPRSGSGTWLSHVDPPSGDREPREADWKPGDYTCTFKAQDWRLAAVVVVE